MGVHAAAAFYNLSRRQLGWPRLTGADLGAAFCPLRCPSIFINVTFFPSLTDYREEHEDRMQVSRRVRFLLRCISSQKKKCVNNLFCMLLSIQVPASWGHAGKPCPLSARWVDVKIKSSSCPKQTRIYAKKKKNVMFGDRLERKKIDPSG